MILIWWSVWQRRWRRGIVDPDEAKRNSKDGDNIAPGFRISGLGQLIEAGIESDRLLVFGD